MPRAIQALLVGIDEYPSPIPTLHGCANDIDAFAAYLTERAGKDGGAALDLRVLKNGEATREAVISGFREHLGKAGTGDVAVFYYSGHGSQEQAPEEFWVLEPDHLDETLVCVDSRDPGGWDLADKEIAKLVNEVAANGPHVLVILDCCHSGSGTRDVGTVVRRAPTDLRRRPIGTFLVSPNEALAAARGRDAAPVAGGSGLLPEGRHVLLAACRDNQEAKEYVGDGTHRGAFSFFLGDALRGAAGAPTYRDLFARASALVASHVSDQSPQIESTVGEGLDAVFLDGLIRPSPATYTASFRDGRWVINGGRANGIPGAVGADAVRLALFRFDAPADDLADPARALATARVEDVQPATSRLAIEGEGDAGLDPAETYKARLMSLPTPPLVAFLDGDAAACDPVREALSTASPERGPSLFVREAGADERAEFRLLARDGQYVITRPDDARPLVAPIDGLNAAGADLAVRRLEHIGRWTQTARLGNPTSTIHPGDVALKIVVDDADVTAREIRLEYRAEGGVQIAPRFRVSMTNTSARTLYCGLLDLTQRFKVDAGLIRAGCVRLDPGETAWGNQGSPIPATVPDELWNQGVIEYRDLLKLIVCTQEFDARLLEQPSLDMPRPRAVATRGVVRNGSLNRLLRKVQTRELSPEEPASIDDWRASEFAFTTVRPLPTTAVPGPGASATLAGGVRLEAHPALKAQARLATATLATRDLGRVALPRMLYDDPTVCQTLAFTTSRGNDPGLSVLELTDVEDPAVVTPDAPLRLTAPLTLRDDEHVLPVAYDGEFFLPLGRVEGREEGSTVIALDRLPPPLADARSLTGAIKIFFYKVISGLTATEFPYPILAAADVDAGGAVVATGDLARVRQRVADARRIVLFVHGITGDTRSMVPSVRLARLADDRPLASLYDLVLTYDYENLNTTIEDNGRALKDRLAAVGLAPGHGKTLDVVAHSMGGLVARWFIEKEGGNQVARRLVMLGTPNGGSPWPRVVDWATVALAVGLNHLTVIAWPSSVLGGLTTLTEKSPTVALNEMLGNSRVLADLAASPDPGIPYVMLAGNTSLIPAAVVASDPKTVSVLGRLLARLTAPRLLHEVANPFFLGQTNDVAVSTASMENILTARTPPYDVRPVSCDHLTYFQDPAGLKALADVLAEGA